MEKEEQVLFWSLYKKAVETGIFNTKRYCDVCKEVFDLPPKGKSNEHWRWRKGMGTHRCLEKDRIVRRRGTERVWNTIEGFLKRKFNILHNRCNNPNNNRYEKSKGRLKFSLEEFMRWGTDSLKQFISEKKIPENKIKSSGIQIDRINPGGGYEPGNVQWILKEDHQIKSIMEWGYKVFQFNTDGSFIRKWNTISELEKEGYNRYSIMRASGKEGKIYKNYLWKIEL